MKDKMATMCAPSWFHVALCKTYLSINLHGLIIIVSHVNMFNVSYDII